MISVHVSTDSCYNFETRIFTQNSALSSLTKTLIHVHENVCIFPHSGDWFQTLVCMRCRGWVPWTKTSPQSESNPRSHWRQYNVRTENWPRTSSYSRPYSMWRRSLLPWPGRRFWRRHNKRKRSHSVSRPFGEIFWSDSKNIQRVWK